MNTQQLADELVLEGIQVSNPRRHKDMGKFECVELFYSKDENMTYGIEVYPREGFGHSIRFVIGRNSLTQQNLAARLFDFDSNKFSSFLSQQKPLGRGFAEIWFRTSGGDEVNPETATKHSKTWDFMCPTVKSTKNLVQYIGDFIQAVRMTGLIQLAEDMEARIYINESVH